MCGLVGWTSARGAVDVETLVAMREAIAHRGPDGAGVVVSESRRVGLAHRRLSIIDRSERAAQPMRATHEGRSATIVFNGEIYNHAALRAELAAAGFRFRTDHSDTEVLLAGFLIWGLEELLARCHGMFALALWDEVLERVYLVRDRIGIKPLYVARAGADLVFASEAKALFEHPALAARLDRRSLRTHLAFRAVPAPDTLFEGVECVGPGGLLEIDVETGTRFRRTWWDPLANRREPPPTLAAAEDELAALLADSVRERLIADTPVGVFLSGGVDSAYLLQLAADGARPLHTFTATHPGQSDYDEGPAATALARARGTEHHEVPIDAETFGRALQRVAWHQDEPIAAPVCTSVYLLAESARQNDVPVVLAGEGSDELFIGYESWLKLRDAERWNRRLPGGALVRHVAGALLVGHRPWTSPAHEILRRATAGEPLFCGGSLDFGERAQARLLGAADGPGTYAAAIEPLRRAFLAEADPSDTTAWMSYVDLRFRLPQLMLPRLDKMGMAFGVEGRVPFLDHRIVELVLGLPPAWRGGRGRTSKALFKAIAERRLPTEFVRRRKRGFRAPVSEWRTGVLGRRYLPALKTFAARTELFDQDALTDLVERRPGRLWFSLVNFMLWYLLYVEDVLAGELVRPAAVRGAEVAVA